MNCYCKIYIKKIKQFFRFMDFQELALQEMALQVGLVFFRWDLKSPCITFVVFNCILILHGIYSPAPQLQIFFWWGLKIFVISCSQGLGKFQISWGPNFHFGRGLGAGAAIFFHKPSMTKHVNTRIVGSKIVFFIYVC